MMFDSLTTLFLILLLSTHLLVIAYNSPDKSSNMNTWMGLLTTCLIIFVCTSDMLLMFLAFECALLPILAMMGLWSTGTRRTHAGWLLLFFTYISASLILPTILLCYDITGSTSILSLPGNDGLRFLLGIGWMGAALSKVPLVPLHLWLPEAHVQASTPVSIVLAAVLLKLSIYIMLRLGGTLANIGDTGTLGLMTIGMTGVVLAVAMAGVQCDMKRVIAYASVAHMSVGVVVWCLGGAGWTILAMLTIAHSIIAGALFMSVGVIYEGTHTRLVKVYGGAAGVAPFLGLLWLVWSVANVGLPGTAGFVGEIWSLLILSGWSGMLGWMGIAFVGTLLYTMWVWVKVMWGPEGVGILWSNVRDVRSSLGGAGVWLGLLAIGAGIAIGGIEGIEGFT